jgi:hypothetical protein
MFHTFHHSFCKLVYSYILRIYWYSYVCRNIFNSRFISNNISSMLHCHWSWDSAVGIATGHGLDDRWVGVRVPVVSRILFSTLSSPTLGPTQSSIQWVPGALSRGQSGWGVKLTTYLQLVPRSRKCGFVHPLPPYAFIALCLIS